MRDTDRVITESFSADMGMNTTSGMPSLATNPVYSSLIRSNTSCE